MSRTPDDVLAAFDKDEFGNRWELADALREALRQRDEARALARHHEARASGYEGWMDLREKERDEARASEHEAHNRLDLIGVERNEYLAELEKVRYKRDRLRAAADRLAETAGAAIANYDAWARFNYMSGDDPPERDSVHTERLRAALAAYREATK